MKILHRILSHPLVRGRDIDAPETTELRRQIIQQKKFLCLIYEEWYALLIKSIPMNKVPIHILELGAGGGFFKDYVQNKSRNYNVIASDVLKLSNVDVVVDATRRLPFEDGSLSGIVMTNVFHHIPDCTLFFQEAARVLMPRGVISMIEPWNTAWARFVYKHLHVEPFDPEGDWTFDAGSPLSSANGALPWIIFSRDLQKFAEHFPQFFAPQITLLMPFSYILSGGVSLRSLAPGFVYKPVRYMESLLPLKDTAMFACITLERVP